MFQTVKLNGTHLVHICKHSARMNDKATKNNKGMS